MSSEPRKRKTTMGLKIISVILSVLLWFYVVNQGELTARNNAIEVELVYYNLSEGLNIEAPTKVSIKLWGKLQETGDVLAYIDLSGLEEGTYVLPVKVEPIKGAMFTSVEPNSVEVHLQEVKEHTVKIQYEITQPPPPDHELLDVQIIPENCVIKGEDAIAEQVKTIVCSIDLSNLKGISTSQLDLSARDAQGKPLNDGLKIIPDSVKVYTVVAEKRSSKKVKVVPQISNYPGTEYQLVDINIQPQTVNILGTELNVQAIEEINTIEIDFAQAKESFSRETALVLPAGVEVYPEKVIINVSIEKLAEEVEE